MDNVTVLGGATLPEEIKDVLNKGPKYSFKPSTSRPELLAMVQRVANSAGEQNREGAIGDGIDCLKDSSEMVFLEARQPFHTAPNVLLLPFCRSETGLGVFSRPPKLRSELKDGKEPEASVNPEAGSASALTKLLLKVAAMCDAVTQRLAVQYSREPELRPQLMGPVYIGYNDAKSIADFLGELDAFKAASDASESLVISRILPLALQSSAACWLKLQPPFTSIAEFERQF
ncbi:hypothetical protein HPB47_001692 [Ixodes persulcatus]|uniref:Uncharacterized protein n=1 Tax=Ixodes persulcatus TaxID=34615 RepID=A0AC60PPK9_IXOPE|nr:hypothetical protein HPB47_001692 [Ixodes persulcatus]